MAKHVAREPIGGLLVGCCDTGLCRGRLVMGVCRGAMVVANYQEGGGAEAVVIHLFALHSLVVESSNNTASKIAGVTEGGGSGYTGGADFGKQDKGQGILAIAGRVGYWWWDMPNLAWDSKWWQRSE